MTGRAVGVKKTKRKNITRTQRAGLIFPVGRIHRFLRSGNFAPRVGSGAAVYMTAALEYLCAEILELAAKATADNKKTRITPRFIMFAVRTDDELNFMLKDVTISQSGSLPSINPMLIPMKTKMPKSPPNNHNNLSSQEY